MLENHQLRPMSVQLSSPFNVKGLYLGKGNQGLEILLCESNNVPNATSIRSIWKQRKGNRASPLLTIVKHGIKASICGPTGEDAPVYQNLDLTQVERICDESLNLPDRHTVLRYLRDVLPAIESSLPGIRNEGFLAIHQLQYGVPKRSDWEESKSKSANAINSIGEDLLTSLGFKVKRHDQGTSILESRDKKTAVAVLLKDYESPELSSDRFSELTPISYALHVADQERLPYIVIVQGRKIRLYPVDSSMGVGRRGRTDTFIELHTSLLKEECASYLWLVFSSDALLPGGSLEDILIDSTRYSGDLATKLRDRIYNEVIPLLCKGIVNDRNINNPSVDDLSDIYEMAMNVLYRLLFIAYAEDKDLLPYKWNGLYQKRSLKTKAQEILEIKSNDTEYDTGDSLWGEINRLFRAIDSGNKEWGVPAYGGELFSSDSEVSRIGELVSTISLSNIIMGPVLENLLLVETDEGLGPVDFRSLGVREFGTIYEGLLESELSLTEEDLTIDKKGFYKPAKENDEIIVSSGEVYIHNSSGVRKASGSYYTKSFAVDHLLDRSLIPALDDHFSSLDNLDDDEAGKAIFDFKIADIAMGSGHFLINAIDKMEIAFSSYLVRRPLHQVRLELNELKNAADESLGPFKYQVEIEDTQLLRRLIARRCIYGVDLNGTAVQLTRLAVWIHTFVPGLALSFLDHNLIQGNSLVGIGQIDEIKEKIEENSLPLFPIDAESLLGDALEPLTRLAMIKDINKTDLERARKAQEEAFNKVIPTKALCDIVTYCRIENQPLPFNMDEWSTIKNTILDSPDYMLSQTIQNQKPLHFPIAFPEVFLRAKKGFDVIVGNPPWDKAIPKEDTFWARKYPGYKSLSKGEQINFADKMIQKNPKIKDELNDEIKFYQDLSKSLKGGAFKGIFKGHVDLYKAFCWRFIDLLNDNGGKLGIVLPRSSISATGGSDFRKAILNKSEIIQICILLNNTKWVFSEVHPQYTIILLNLTKSEKTHNVPVYLNGPISSFDELLKSYKTEDVLIRSDEIISWSKGAKIPLLRNQLSLDVYRKMKSYPSFNSDNRDDFKGITVQGDLNSTSQRNLLTFQKPDNNNFYPIYKGSSFNIWNPDTNQYFAWFEKDKFEEWLKAKLRRSNYFIEKQILPIHKPRIGFRKISRSTDSRTTIAALLPPNIGLYDGVQYIRLIDGGPIIEAYLLGIISSLPFDWLTRSIVEVNLTLDIFNNMPIPIFNNSEIQKKLLNISSRLACIDKRFIEWAKKVGVDYGPVSDDEKQDMIEELDAVVANLYGLNEKQLIHIFETFHVGWDYEERLRSTLKHYNSWKGKV